jgi:hypothetical protein
MVAVRSALKNNSQLGREFLSQSFTFQVQGFVCEPPPPVTIQLPPLAVPPGVPDANPTLFSRVTALHLLQRHFYCF